MLTLKELLNSIYRIAVAFSTDVHTYFEETTGVMAAMIYYKVNINYSSEFWHSVFSIITAAISALVVHVLKINDFNLLKIYQKFKNIIKKNIKKKNKRKL